MMKIKDFQHAKNPRLLSMKKITLVLSLVILIFIVSCTANKPIENLPQSSPLPVSTNQVIPEESPTIPLSQPTPLPTEEEKIKNEKEQPKTGLWVEGNAAISGKYADADVITLDDGKYRMYYSEEPEVPGFKGQVYSALSSDGNNWAQEDGTRMEWAIFPSVIKLQDGRFRMYFQNQGVIKSTVSSDGLLWKDEAGTRIDIANNAGFKLENVAAPTVIKVNDEYILVYRGTINEKYPAPVPNNNIQLLLWATSKDGLAFEKKGIALDSRNDIFYGLLDGPEFVKWDNHEIRLYFWSYKGIYHLTYNDGVFSKDAIFDYTTNDNPLNPFPENPPSDPTLAKITDKWFMYYGQHEKGIFYAVLE